jgi:hypothetical protein
MMDEDERYEFLKKVTKSDSAIDELLAYSENKFISKKDNYSTTEEDTYLNTWENYGVESKEIGAFNTLKKYIVQFQFPVEKGISKTEAYINSTLKGKANLSDSGLKLNKPNAISLELYNSPLCGKVPVLIVPNDKDFVTVICALSNKNEPQELPKSMGASFINGLNNWDRIQRLKRDWLKQNPTGSWNLYFKEQILPKPYLFKDKLMVLSTKAYSGVKSEFIGLSKKTWESSSLMIRREHECTHLFTLKQYGCMANNMHDEIVADYAGITRVLGHYNKEWFLRFVGLENYPKYRKGGRLENYQGLNNLSKEAFEGLKTLVKNATDSIYKFDNALGEITSSIDQLNRIKSICEIDLITMAMPQGYQKLIEKYNSKNVSEVVGL